MSPEVMPILVYIGWIILVIFWFSVRWARDQRHTWAGSLKQAGVVAGAVLFFLVISSIPFVAIVLLFG